MTVDKGQQAGGVRSLSYLKRTEEFKKMLVKMFAEHCDTLVCTL